jgi:hypothetical protein
MALAPMPVKVGSIWRCDRQLFCISQRFPFLHMFGAIRLLLVGIFCCGTLHADLGLILGEATSRGMSKWTQAGHSAVYLSNVCAESPVRLRLCRSGERGVVISTYSHFKEDKPYEWNAVPLNVFLYGLDDENFRPLYASHELRIALQANFRRTFLNDVCSAESCLSANAQWRDLVGESFVRGMYIFMVKTSAKQDLRFLNELNSRSNVNRYSGFRNNCADFALRIVNFYFPRAVHADPLNDFGMTSPKAIARSFARFAKRQSELDYRVIHVAQLPGAFPSSKDCRNGTEAAFRSKRWLIPMLLKSHELALFATTYFLTGRFSPEKEFEQHQAFESLESATSDKTISLSMPVARDYDNYDSIAIDSDRSTWGAVVEP